MKIHNEKLLDEYKTNGKLNVAFFSDIYRPFIGGVTTVIENLAENLKDKCNIILFCQGARRYHGNVDFPVIRAKLCRLLKV